MSSRRRRAGSGASLVDLERAYRGRYPDLLRVATAKRIIGKDSAGQVVGTITIPGS